MVARDDGPVRRILFWSALSPPQNHVRHDVLGLYRAIVIAALQNGEPIMAYMGWAECRICGEHLGTRDMTTHNLIYPEKAEHYLLEHSVWTPGCDELLRRILARSGGIE